MFYINKGSNNSKRFKPHENQATGKSYYTKDDYLKDLKKMNLVPYEKPKEKSDPQYKPTSWGHQMAEEIKNSKGKPGSRFYDELAKKGYTREKIKSMNKRALDNKDKGNVGGFE